MTSPVMSLNRDLGLNQQRAVPALAIPWMGVMGGVVVAEVKAEGFSAEAIRHRVVPALLVQAGRAYRGSFCLAI